MNPTRFRRALDHLSRTGLARPGIFRCPVSVESNQYVLQQRWQCCESLSGEEASEGSLMSVKRHLGNLAAATALVLAACGMGGVANAADPFTLTSATFKDGTMMPKKVANKINPANPNPNCVGENVSPQLSWSG